MRPADAIPRTVGEVEGFIALLRSACSDAAVNARLQEVLSLPDQRRKALLHTWITDILTSDGPRELAHALACLLDDAVAEKAYEVIYQCGVSPDPGASFRPWTVAIGVVAACFLVAMLVAFLVPTRVKAPATAVPQLASSAGVSRYQEHIAHAWRLLREGKPAETLKAVEAASRERGYDVVQIEFYKGWAFQDLKRYDEAAAAFTNALNIRDFVSGYWRRGLAHEAMGDRNRARDDFIRAAQVLAARRHSDSGFIRDVVRPRLREKLREYGLAAEYPI